MNFLLTIRLQSRLPLLLPIALIVLVNCQEIRQLQYDTGVFITNITANNIRSSKRQCLDRITAAIDSKLIQEKIDYRDRILETFSNTTNLAKICRLYDDSVPELNKCSKNERNTPNALLIILQILCVKRHSALSIISECSATMEEYVAEKCQKYCLTRPDPQSVSRHQVSCSFAECTANCINIQLRECDGPKEAADLYNELAGAQMLLGIESAFNGESSEMHRLLGSRMIPIRCRLLIQKALTAAMEVRKLAKLEKTYRWKS